MVNSLNRLLATVKALAQPGADALAGLPKGARPDRLAIDFDEAYTAFVGQLNELPSETQMEALQRLDQQLERMSDPRLAAKLWTAEAMKKENAWESVRAIAAEILASF